MAFSKAKRFVYKKPEITPSPADYAITTTLEKGCIIPKSPRFVTPAREDESSFLSCSRTHSHRDCLRSSTPKTKKEYTTGCNDLDGLKRNIVELNRNDNKRQSLIKNSIKTRSTPSGTNEKSNESRSNLCQYCNNFANQDPESLNLPRRDALVDHDYCSSGSESSKTKIESSNFNSSKYANNICQKCYLRRREEFIDDDLTSITVIKKVNHKLDRLQSDLEKIQLRSRQQNYCQCPRSLLENLNNKLNAINNDITKFNECFNERNTREKVECKKYDKKQMCLPGSTKYEEINCIIRNSVRFIRNQFEKHGKSLKKETEERLRSIFIDLFVTTEKSTEQFHEYCTHTSNHLSKRINRTLNITPPSVSGSRSSASEATMTANDDDYADEDDILDYTLKLGNTEETLKLQESLLEAVKKDLADLKESIYKFN